MRPIGGCEADLDVCSLVFEPNGDRNWKRTCSFGVFAAGRSLGLLELLLEELVELSAGTRVVLRFGLVGWLLLLLLLLLNVEFILVTKLSKVFLRNDAIG